MPVYKLMNASGELDSIMVKCSCGFPEHELRISAIAWSDQTDYTIQVHLSTWHNFFGRLKNAIKYLFGHRSRYGDFDEIVITQQDITDLFNIWLERN